MTEDNFNILTDKELKKIKNTFLDLFKEFDLSLIKIIALRELKIANYDSESAHEVYAYLQFISDNIELSENPYKKGVKKWAYQIFTKL